MKRHLISFLNGERIEVNEGQCLSEALDVINSPILFGCRTGICATCLVEVLDGMENLPPPSAEEVEVLEIYADRPHCRLACQLSVSGPVRLNYVGK